MDVVRAAVAEVEDYERVEVRRLPEDRRRRPRRRRPHPPDRRTARERHGVLAPAHRGPGARRAGRQRLHAGDPRPRPRHGARTSCSTPICGSRRHPSSSSPTPTGSASSWSAGSPSGRTSGSRSSRPRTAGRPRSSSSRPPCSPTPPTPRHRLPPRPQERQRPGPTSPGWRERRTPAGDHRTAGRGPPGSRRPRGPSGRRRPCSRTRRAKAPSGAGLGGRSTVLTRRGSLRRGFPDAQEPTRPAARRPGRASEHGRPPTAPAAPRGRPSDAAPTRRRPVADRTPGRADSAAAAHPRHRPRSQSAPTRPDPTRTAGPYRAEEPPRALPARSTHARRPEPDVTRTVDGLPRRVRQASLAPQLREDAAAERTAGQGPRGRRGRRRARRGRSTQPHGLAATGLAARPLGRTGPRTPPGTSPGRDSTRNDIGGGRSMTAPNAAHAAGAARQRVRRTQLAARRTGATASAASARHWCSPATGWPPAPRKDLTREDSEHLAAVASGFHSLAKGVGTALRRGPGPPDRRRTRRGVPLRHRGGRRQLPRRARRRRLRRGPGRVRDDADGQAGGGPPRHRARGPVMPAGG